MSEMWADEEPIALAYDDTDDELVAKVYTREAMAELKDAWWIRVEETADSVGEVDENVD